MLFIHTSLIGSVPSGRLKRLFSSLFKICGIDIRSSMILTAAIGCKGFNVFTIRQRQLSRNVRRGYCILISLRHGTIRAGLFGSRILYGFGQYLGRLVTYNQIKLVLSKILNKFHKFVFTYTH